MLADSAKQIYVACMPACLHMHVVAIRLAKSFVTSYRITYDESDDMHGEDYHRNS